MTALATLISGNLTAVNPDPKTITLGHANGSADEVIEYAKKTKVTNREASESYGKYTRSDVKWLMESARVTVPPVPGDTIGDPDGVTWVVLDVDQFYLDTIYRVWSRKLSVQPTLGDSVSIEKGTATKDASGGPIYTWATEYDNITCRMQQSDGRETRSQDQTRIVPIWEVVLSERLAVNSRYRVVWGTRVFRIIGYSDRQSIRGFEMLDVVELTADDDTIGGTTEILPSGDIAELG